ncbi:MAG: hypothetical protein HY645_10740 [Acidobacteria bacterium]|nr:hypothetical protein [Acidobacteriota bacterium]
MNVKAQKRVLLVQCCHLPQFFYVHNRLRELHPEWEIHRLMSSHPQVQECLKTFSLVEGTYFVEDARQIPEFDLIVFPLLNRGYSRIRKRAASLPGQLTECDYQGHVSPVGKWLLLKSIFAPPYKCPPEFLDFAKDFPVWRLSGNVLLIPSCREFTLKRTEKRWSALISEDSRVFKAPGSARKAWQLIRTRKFDSVLAFFSGEKGYLSLKLLPFFSRIRRIVIVNENGDHLEGSLRSMTRFLAYRLSSGRAAWKNHPRILLIQTESPRYVCETARLLKSKVFPRCEILALCRNEDQNEIEACADLDQIAWFSRNSFQQNWRTLLQALRFRPDLLSAIFTGRPVFRKTKLLFFLFPIRRRLVTNAQLDCYPLTFGTLPRIFRKDLFTFQPAHERILLIQTEDPRYVRKAARLLKTKVSPSSEILALCRWQDREFLASCPDIDTLCWFSKRLFWRNCRTLIRLLRFRPYRAAAIFTGRPVFRKAKLLFFLFPVLRRVVVNAQLGCYSLNPRTFPLVFRKDRYLFEEIPLTPRRILLIQTEDPRYVREAARLLKTKIFPSSEILVLCRWEDREFLEGCADIDTLAWFSKRSLFKNCRTLIRMLRFRPYSAAAIFTGRPVFRKAKLLFFLFPVLRRVVVNAQLGCYSLNPTTLPLIFRRDRYLFEEILANPQKILLIQTEHPLYVREAARLLRARIFPSCEILALCRWEDRKSFEDFAEIKKLEWLSRGSFHAGLKAVFKALRFRPAACAAIFTGRPVFRNAKLLFFLFPYRRKLVFNARLDCYRLWPNTFPRIFRREPILFDLPETSIEHRVLLIQTDEGALHKKAAEMVQDPSILGQTRLAVLAPRDQQDHFRDVPGIEKVFTYGRGCNHLKVMFSLLAYRPTVKAAVLTGKPVFKLQKLLFRLFPAKETLIFNEQLICFSSQDTLSYSRGSDSFLQEAPLSALFRPLCKATLFFPRFFYLVIWVTLQRRRRSYTVSLESSVSPLSNSREERPIKPP